MNFSFLEVESPKKLKKLSKRKISFLNKKDEDVSVFHYNAVDEEIIHVVFNINDEYQVSTLKLGNQYNFSYSSLLNFFFIPNRNYAFLEYINQEFEEMVIKEINNRCGTSIDSSKFINKNFWEIYVGLNGTIKKLNYTRTIGNDTRRFKR